MGYYAPSFGGLDRGWYLTTTDSRYAEERDQCLQWWNSECDMVLAEFLRQYGMFFSAFEQDVKAEIKARFGRRLKFPNYFGYFIVSRVLADPNLAQRYHGDYARRAHLTIDCSVCNGQQTYDNIHPSLVRRTRRILPLCNECWFWIAEFTELEHLTSVGDDLKERVRRLSSPQVCPICHRKFVWLARGECKTYEVPFLPGRHIEICPQCVATAICGDPKNADADSCFTKFKRIADLLEVIPDKSGFVYDDADTLDVAVEVTQLMQQLPPFEVMARSCGSWFELLLAAGVLPPDARKNSYGVTVKAVDGHQCFSLAEKTIDDLLFRNNIPHEKEPLYPGTAFRADWKISAAGRDIYIELFGLDGDPDYAKRKRQKLAIAKKAGMSIIAIERKDLASLKRAFRAKILSLFPEPTLQCTVD